MQDTTVLISSSPIESHPATDIIVETLASIRKHFPTAPIYILQDGVRPEQIHHIDRYIEYLHRLAAHCVLHEKNVTMMPFPEFYHQAYMTMRALEVVSSPFVLYCEHDTGLLDRPIDWQMLKEKIEAGETYHVRLHYDETIHPEHQHLMQGKVGDHFIKTIQYHNRPFLCDREWFEALLRTAFTKESRSFIEDRVYTFIAHSPWDVYRCTVYDPTGDGTMMKRSGHTNGRGSEPKYEMKF